MKSTNADRYHMNHRKLKMNNNIEPIDDYENDIGARKTEMNSHRIGSDMVTVGYISYPTSPIVIDMMLLALSEGPSPGIYPLWHLDIDMSQSEKKENPHPEIPQVEKAIPAQTVPTK